MPTRTSTDADVRALDGLHLYHARLSNSSMRVRLLLEEKGRPGPATGSTPPGKTT